MEKLVQVREIQEKTVLFECLITQIEQAYRYASEMEEMGVEVEILAPSLPESLAIELGANKEGIKKLRSEIGEEIASHIDEGCSLCLDDPKEELKH